MSIREATIDDLPAFDRLRQACFSWSPRSRTRSSVSAWPSSMWPPRNPASARWSARCILTLAGAATARRSTSHSWPTHTGTSYGLWLQRLWKSPDLNLETGRCWSGGTATLPAYRGRGLAKVLKSVALRKAAAVGITKAITANDYTNAAMLAVNDWLGYRALDSQVSMLKSLQGADDVADDDDGGRA